jgi:hypothetical protein
MIFPVTALFECAVKTYFIATSVIYSNRVRFNCLLERGLKNI